MSPGVTSLFWLRYDPAFSDLRRRPGCRRLRCAMKRLGHRVVAEAGSVSEALPLAEQAEFDLALLDINVGGDNSADIAAIVERRSLLFL
jgi:DNA-binding NarL/FixJ family response regulator